MQNIADELAQTFPERLDPGSYQDLDTFVVYNSRTKVSSSAKRRRKSGEMNLHQVGACTFRWRNARLGGECTFEWRNARLGGGMHV
jgi:hypothetical protein